MDIRQVRGFDLRYHAVDPATGAALCGLPARKLGPNVGGAFRGKHPKSCAACVAAAAAGKGRRSGSGGRRPSY